jgi:hypothetical protein
MSSVNNVVTQKQVTWVRVMSAAAMIGALAIAAPVLWLAVSAGAGLLALAAILATMFVSIQALPLLGQKLENALLSARKAEARKNPIEQLQNEVLRRAERLKDFHRALVSVGGQIESIGEMVAERRHRDPTHVLERQEQALIKLQQFHSLNLTRLSQARSALDEFKFTVERKESEWRIALAIGEANDLMDPNATNNLMQDLLTDTALRTVQERFNSVFAELDVQMSSLDGPTRALLKDNSLDRMGALHLPQASTIKSHL